MVNMKKLGFTLTELLIALTIIGALAAIAIPTLLEGLHRRTLSISLKNSIKSIQEMSGKHLALNQTMNLLDTDFAKPNILLSERNMSIAQVCDKSVSCWNSSYRTISGSPATRVNEGNPRTVILKNGQILSYRLTPGKKLPDGDYMIGIFYIDTNGREKPNMLGRDLFWFEISRKGKIINHYEAINAKYNKATATKDCKSGSTYTACFSVLQMNNWEMDY